MVTLSQAKLSNVESPNILPSSMLWRVRVEQYHAMIQSGILTEDDPVELLQGWLVQKMPKNPQHSTVTRLLQTILTQLMPEGWFVNNQEPITTEDSEPEPDITIVRGTPRDYFAHHPQPADIGLLIEVSDATLYRDRTVKKQLYAMAGIPVYWIVNLQSGQIELYTNPTGPTSEPDYHQQQTYSFTEDVPVTIFGQAVGNIPANYLVP